MQKQLVRTTVQIDQDLYKSVKLKMLNEQLSFRQMVETSLRAVVNDQLDLNPQRKTRKKKIKFGGYNLGGIKGKLSRKEIYEEVQTSII